MSQQSFADLGVSRAVAGALAERGITEPFAIQQLVIADVLAGHDVLAKSPTGIGQDHRLRRPHRGPHRGRATAARRPSSSPPPASWPARSSTTSARWPTPAR